MFKVQKGQGWCGKCPLFPCPRCGIELRCYKEDEPCVICEPLKPDCHYCHQVPVRQPLDWCRQRKVKCRKWGEDWADLPGHLCKQCELWRIHCDDITIDEWGKWCDRCKLACSSCGNNQVAAARQVDKC